MHFYECPSDQSLCRWSAVRTLRNIALDPNEMTIKAEDRPIKPEREERMRVGAFQQTRWQMTQ